MPRLILLLLALTLAACNGDRDAARDEQPAEPMDAPTAPNGDTDPVDRTTFSDLVDGQSIVLTADDGHLVCLRFTGPWRFESYDPDLMEWYAGDYADLSESNEPGAAGTLVFMWDDPDPAYAPDDAELALRLTFASEISGAFEYDYAEGDDVHPTVAGDFDIVEGQIDEADCGGDEG